MRWCAWAIAAVLACIATVPAAHAKDALIEPRAGSPVRDREFGVQTRGFGLDRRVEMLQWQATPTGYRRVWHDAAINASTHDTAHANPPMPLQSRRWWSDTARIDRAPIDRSVLQALGTWQRFRPDFAALPSNLAVTFQPEGDGLGSAVNPLDPQIGDVRVTWRELKLPPLDGRVELREGTWRLRDVADVVVAPSPLEPAPTPAPTPVAPPRDNAPPPWPWIAGVLVFAIVVVLWRAVRLRRHARRRRAMQG